jgi:biopolymer transport protein ExbB
MRRVFTGFLSVLFLSLLVTPALAQEETKTMSYFEMFFLSDDIIGLIMVWVIILMSVVQAGAAAYFFSKYRRSTIIPEMTYQQLELMLEEKRYKDAIEFAAADPSYLARLVDAALNEASNGFASMERAMEEASDAEATKMLRPVEFLNVLGNVAPMCGLFGTVYGMIVAFSKLVESGGKPDPAKLAAGISTALVTTFWGLVVAIPALSAYAWIRNKVDALCAEGMIMAEELISPFKPGGKKKESSAKRPAPAGGARPAPPGPLPKPAPAKA